MCPGKRQVKQDTLQNRQMRSANILRSCPPVPGVMPETGDFWANEAGYHGHVKTLANRAEDSSVFFCGRRCWTPNDMIYVQKLWNTSIYTSTHISEFFETTPFQGLKDLYPQYGGDKLPSLKLQELMLEMKSTSSPVEIEETVLPSLGFLAICIYLSTFLNVCWYPFPSFYHL